MKDGERVNSRSLERFDRRDIVAGVVRRRNDLSRSSSRWEGPYQSVGDEQANVSPTAAAKRSAGDVYFVAIAIASVL